MVTFGDLLFNATLRILLLYSAKETYRVYPSTTTSTLTGLNSGRLKGAGFHPWKYSSGVKNLRPMFNANWNQRNKTSKSHQSAGNSSCTSYTVEITSTSMSWWTSYVWSSLQGVNIITFPRTRAMTMDKHHGWNHITSSCNNVIFHPFSVNTMRYCGVTDKFNISNECASYPVNLLAAIFLMTGQILYMLLNDSLERWVGNVRPPRPKMINLLWTLCKINQIFMHTYPLGFQSFPSQIQLTSLSLQEKSFFFPGLHLSGLPAASVNQQHRCIMLRGQVGMPRPLGL